MGAEGVKGIYSKRDKCRRGWGVGGGREEGCGRKKISDGEEARDRAGRDNLPLPPLADITWRSVTTGVRQIPSSLNHNGAIRRQRHPTPHMHRPTPSLIVAHSHLRAQTPQKPTHPLGELRVHHEVVHVLLGLGQLQLPGYHGNHQSRAAGALRRRENSAESVGKEAESVNWRLLAVESAQMSESSEGKYEDTTEAEVIGRARGED